MSLGLRMIPLDRTYHFDPPAPWDETHRPKAATLEKVMALDNIVMIVASIVKGSIEGLETWPERIKAAFSTAWESDWPTGDEQTKFKGALAALLLLAKDLGDDDASDIINAELLALKTLSAAMSGVPVDFEAIGDPLEELKERGLEAFGLMGAWHESKGD